VIRAPVIMGLVRRPDGLVLVLWGVKQVDLPAVLLKPGEEPADVLRAKLRTVGVEAKTLNLRWSGAVSMGGGIRPVSVYEAVEWSGEPHGHDWAREEQVCCGTNAATYRVLFARLRERRAS
jgi:hypothetical protein